MKDLNKEAQKIINNSVSFTMMAAVFPIPVIDIATITSIQLDMVKKLARLYDVEFSSEAIRSFVSSIAANSVRAGLITVSSSLLKGIPVVGAVVGISSQVIISSATTYAVGQVTAEHFEKNGTLKNFKFRDYRERFTEFFNQGKRKAKEEEKRKERKSETMNRMDILNTISKLKDLKEEGIISEEEYEITKKELMKKLMDL